MNKKLFLYLTLTTLISLFIRLYQLGDVPNGLTVDEADMAYNSYSIMETGADVYNKKYPLFFQALDDYKPGLAHYVTIPAIYIFGLNDFAVRFAAFVFGLLSLPLVFILSRLLYPKNTLAPFISTILVSFAPWHISLSRAMVWYIELIFLYLLFFSLFLLAQRKEIKNKQRLIFLSAGALILALTLYVYYASIIYLPMVIILVLLIYRDFLKANIKGSLVAMSIFVIFSLPAFLHYSSQESKTRLNAISVLTPDITLPTSILEIEQDKFEGRPFSQLIHNRRLVYSSALLDNYFDYFNLDYLFVTAKNTRYFYVNNVGLFHLIELPFFFYGLFLMLKRREKSDLLLLSFLVVGPIPAAFTLGSPFPHRALLTILAVQLISAVGIGTVLGKIFRTVYIKFALGAIYILSVCLFLHQYFVHSPQEFTSELDNGAWFSTVRESIPKVNAQQDQYKKVVFTWSTPKLVPGIYYLFYNKVDPKIIQSKASLWANVEPSYKQLFNEVENIEFRPINWKLDKNLKNTLFVGYREEFPADVKIIDQTHLPNGKEHFVFVESN